MLGLADRAIRHLLPLRGILPAKTAIRFGWSQIRALAKRDPSIIVGTMLALNFLRLISSLIVTRLLAPADFGILGLISVVHYSVCMLFDVGADAFVVRHKDVEGRRIFDVLWTVRFARTMLSAAIVAVFAGLFARLLGNEALAAPLAISALALVAAAPQSLTFSLATRNKQLVLMSSIDVALAVLNLAVTVGLAFVFRNYWAAVVSSILGSAVRTLISYMMFPSPAYRFAYDKELASEIWRFTRYVTGSSVITLFLSQVDKIVLSHFLTIDQFGIYMLAAKRARAVAQIPTQVSRSKRDLTWPCVQVLYEQRSIVCRKLSVAPV